MRALAAPASLKGVLSARDAAEALARGLREGGAEATAMPVADGGDGTLDVLGAHASRREAEVSAPLGGRVRVWWALGDDGTAIVESAEPLGFQTVSTLDPLRASSRGLGELILAASREADALLVCLGGTVTVDGGAGMREVLEELPLPTRVACDVMSPLLDAVYVFARQKGASEDDFEVLAERLRGLDDRGAVVAKRPPRPHTAAERRGHCRGPRRLLCVVVVTKCACGIGLGCWPPATSPAMCAMSTNRSAPTA